MASMGLPLAFGSTSSQMSEVSVSMLLRSLQKMFSSVHCSSITAKEKVGNILGATCGRGAGGRASVFGKR